MKKILRFFNFCQTEVPAPRDENDLPYLSDDSEPIYHPFPTQITTLERNNIEKESQFKPTIVIEDARDNQGRKSPNKKVNSNLFIILVCSFNYFWYGFYKLFI